jgi:hypothetical protein
MEITFNARELVEDLDDLRIKKIPAAVRRAMTRALNSGKTAMARDISSDMGLKVSYVKDQLKTAVSGDGVEGFEARLSVSGKRIPLIQFNARGPEPTRGRGRGVTASGGSGNGRTQYRSAFIATMSSGYHGVFQRVGPGARKSRGPGRRTCRSWS